MNTSKMRYFQLITSSKFNLKILYTMWHCRLSYSSYVVQMKLTKSYIPSETAIGQLMVNFKLCVFKWEDQLQMVLWAINVSRLVQTRKHCCSNKIAFRKQKLFSKHFLLLCETQVFSSTYESYINEVKYYKYRSAITKFQISAHSLPIERGRWMSVHRNKRICPLCIGNVLGDEKHYIFHCTNIK